MFVIVDNSKTHEECPSDDTHTQKMIEKRERPCVILAAGGSGGAGVAVVAGDAGGAETDLEGF
jgi:hypothetical protein